jgi:hypothetical protein
MSDEQMVSDEKAPIPIARGRRRRNQKSDGQDGAPVAVFTGQGEANTPGALNSALKETPKDDDGVDPKHPCKANVRILDRQRALVETDRKKFAICGFASSTRHLIPIDDPAWEIWGMNQLYRHVKRADRWFDVHWNWDKELVPGTDHVGWIRDSGIPVYMIEAHKELPTSVRFPLDVLMATFADYFTSTVAHMTALAIWEIDRIVHGRLAKMAPMAPLDTVRALRDLYAEYSIGFFGIDLIVGEEYGWQKPCAEFWIGAAAIGRGIEVYTPSQSALCKQRFRYGYETEPATIIKPAEVERHKASLVAERDKMMRQMFLLDGAIQTDDYYHELIELRLRGGDIKI